MEYMYLYGIYRFQYATTVLMIVILEIAVGVVAVLYKSKVDSFLQTYMQKTIDDYYNGKYLMIMWNPFLLKFFSSTQWLHLAFRVLKISVLLSLSPVHPCSEWNLHLARDN